MNYASNLGSFSLLDTLKNVAGAIIRGTKVSIPTPAGAQTYDLGNPAHVAALENMVKGTSISTTASNRPAPAAISPLGWLAIGGGVLLLISLARKS